MNAPALHFPCPRRLLAYGGTFKAYDVISKNVHSFQFIHGGRTWAQVTWRASGTTGWAVRDGEEVLKLHVCTWCPCTIRPKSQYGLQPPPRHVRFMCYIDEDAPMITGFQRLKPAVAGVPVPDPTTAEPSAPEHTTAEPPEPEPTNAEPSEPATADPIRTGNNDRNLWYGNRARNQIVTLNMPTRCPEEDSNCKDYRRVTLHITDRRQIWLSIDDIEWAIKYLFVQHQLRGVAAIADDDEGPWQCLAITDAHPPAAD